MSTGNPDPFAIVSETNDVSKVMTHILRLVERLDTQTVLQGFIDSAITITQAKYAAIAVLDQKGNTTQFVYSGIPESVAQHIGHPPVGLGVFGDIPIDGYIIVNDLETYENRHPWPNNHPMMKNFLGVPLVIRGELYGRLYIAHKEGGFTEEDARNMVLLAQATTIALNNARLYAESANRARWIATSRSITSALLEDQDEEEILELITREIRKVSNSDAALLILPSLNDTWICEITDGDGSSDFIGIQFPSDGHAQSAIHEGIGSLGLSLSTNENIIEEIPLLAEYESSLYAPMLSNKGVMGLIILLRKDDKPQFDLSDLSMAENVAKQAAVAFEIAQTRVENSQASQLEDRAQISRDLHDFAIQQLFATGMELTAEREKLAELPTPPANIMDCLDRAISSIDESVSQIRQIIYSLRDPEATIPLMDRLRNELKQATNSLGFAPESLIKNLGEVIDDDGKHTEIDDELGSDIADDIIAVARECLSNAARHAQASAVNFSLIIENHKVLLVIEDNGKGVDPENTRRSGLSNLATRARRHKGTFSISPGYGGKGTRIEWTAIVE